MDCKKGTKNIAQQINSLLIQLDQTTFAQPLDIFNGSSLGQHFRHIIDFYDCLVSGSNSGRVDYAARKRQTGIETDPRLALNEFNAILNQVEQLNELNKVEVKADFPTNGQDVRPIVQSSVGRELMFASDHAIHHLALIKIGLQTAFPHLVIDKNIGVAPSTIKYQVESKGVG